MIANYVAAGFVILAAVVVVAAVGYLTMPSHMRRSARRRKGSEMPDNDTIFGPPRHREQAGECTRCGEPWPCEASKKGSGS